jgi:hypothetical protein
MSQMATLEVEGVGAYDQMAMADRADSGRRITLNGHWWCGQYGSAPLWKFVLDGWHGLW